MRSILVIGAAGQIGTELVQALRQKYGGEHVIAADLKSVGGDQKITGPFLPLDVLDKETLSVQVCRHDVGTIYLLAAILSATGEAQPHKAWDLNMRSLLNVLEIARVANLEKVFWPSSIAAFGPDAPKTDCPQNVKLSPTTVYGISKSAGEDWCAYYHTRYGVDVRSLRYPGLISHQTMPGGGTTDYAVAIFHAALKQRFYQSFLLADTKLPMMFMDDAVRATMELMEAPVENISVRSSYNISAMSFTPAEVAAVIQKYVPGFSISYAPDSRQSIANSWPGSIDDAKARADWGWKPHYDLQKMVQVMLESLRHLSPKNVSIY